MRHRWGPRRPGASQTDVTGRRKTIIIAAAISLIAVGAAGAVAVDNVVHVRSGDRIIVNKNLGCFVGPSNIVCGSRCSSLGRACGAPR